MCVCVCVCVCVDDYSCIFIDDDTLWIFRRFSKR